MKSNIIHLLLRKFFLNIANNREYVNFYCNIPPNSFDPHFREWYIYNSGNDVDDLPDVGFSW